MKGRRKGGKYRKRKETKKGKVRLTIEIEKNKTNNLRGKEQRNKQ